MSEKRTFPHKIGWQHLAGALSNALKGTYKAMQQHNGEGRDQLVLGTGCAYPGKLVLPTGERAMKGDGIALMLVAVPVGCQSDAEAFCKWMGKNIEGLLAEAAQVQSDLAAANEDARKAWGEDEDGSQGDADTAC